MKFVFEIEVQSHNWCLKLISEVEVEAEFEIEVEVQILSQDLKPKSNLGYKVAKMVVIKKDETLLF